MFDLGALLELLKNAPADLLKAGGDALKAGGATANIGGPSNPVAMDGKVNTNGGGADPWADMRNSGQVQSNPQAAPAAAPQSQGLLSGLSNMLDFGEEKNMAISKGLAGFSQAMAKASAPSDTPTSLLSALSQGLSSGASEYGDYRGGKTGRDYKDAQLTSLQNSNDPNFMSTRALAGQGLVQDASGNWVQAPGVTAIEDSKYQRTMDAVMGGEARAEARDIRNDERTAAAQEARDQRIIEGRQQAAEAAVAAKAGPDGMPKLSATELKNLNEDQNAVQAYDNSIRNLGKALDLNDEIYTGYGADTRGAIGSFFGDDAAAKTSEYTNIVGSNTMAGLKTTLGSQISDADLRAAENLSASVSKSPEVRRALIQNQLDTIRADRNFRANRIKEYGRQVPDAPAPWAPRNAEAPAPGAPAATSPSAPSPTPAAPAATAPAANLPTLSELGQAGFEALPMGAWYSHNGRRLQKLRK